MTTEVVAQIVGAGATAFAAVVALILPPWMDKKTRARSHDAIQSDMAEMCHSIDRVIVLYLDVRAIVESSTWKNCETRICQIETESAVLGRVLDRMLNKPAMTDGLAVAATAAMSVAEGTALAASELKKANLMSAGQKMKALHHQAQLANSRNERVRQYHGLKRIDGSGAPIV